MARRPPFRPGIRILALGVVVAGMYSGMAGSQHLTPSLGLDLRGGTQVTLTPVKTCGQTATKQQLTTAVNIIRQRVNGLGVANADVVVQGSTVVVSVPGKGRTDVLNQVGQTAALSFRETWTDPTGAVTNPAINPSAVTTTPSTNPSTPATTSPTTPATSKPATTPSATTTTVKPRVLSQDLLAATPTPTPSAGATTPATAPVTSPVTSPAASPSASAPANPTPQDCAALAVQNATNANGTPFDKAACLTAAGGDTAKQYVCNQTAAESACVGSLPPQKAGEAKQTTPAACTIATFETLDCSLNSGRPLTVDEDPNHYVIACDRTGQAKYLLKPADLVGTQVSGAVATIGTTSTGASTGAWEVDVTFKDSAVSQVQSISQTLFDNSMQPLAITLDGVVVSNPSTNGVLGKNIVISGGNPAFTQKESSNLANALKYGSLPVSFNRPAAETISASLGRSSLHNGLLAGAIGLALVVIFVFLYYRMLGFVTVLSLITSGALVYASVVLLGQAIGYTLTLAGIAGLIVAIGITADSFVVYFERLKDEIREGRSPRLAVEYGWRRAWRTILTADVVSFLAAFILYLVSIGDVKGFAFTLGLSTVLDIVVVQLFTRPMISLLIKYPLFSTSRLSGLHPGLVGRPSARAPKEA